MPSPFLKGRASFLRLKVPEQKEEILARDNYSYQRYQKELAKKKKKEEKMLRKLNNKKIKAGEDPSQVLPDQGIQQPPLV